MKKPFLILIILTLIILITMGFLNFFISKEKGDSRFVTEESYKRNSEDQTRMTPQTLEQLRELGVDEKKELRLEYFFYTNATDKAKKLAEEIQSLDYSVEYGKSAGDAKLFVISGWTSKMPMETTGVINWTKQMCELGYQFDCEFDGWGTNPDQE